MAKKTLTSEYNTSRPQYEVFTSQIQSLIKELLAAEGIPYHFIDARTKELSSLEYKLKRKRYRTLNEITDLSCIGSG